MQRCSAKSKRSGKQCKNYAVKGFNVCRMHGARGGAKTPQGKTKSRMARLTHGYYSEFERDERRAMRQEIKAAKNLEQHVDSLSHARCR